MFAYSVLNSANYIGSEIKNPLKNIPLSLLISTIIVIVLYIFLNLFFIYAVPSEKMVNEPEIGGLAAGLAFGKTAEMVISLFISFALFSSLSAFILLGPRVYYSMAKEGYFFDFASKIHHRYKVPHLAILLQSSIAIVLVLSGTFEQILVYMGFSLGIFPIIAVLGVFKLRLTGKSKLKLPGYPVVHVFFIVAGIVMLGLAYFERPVESSIAVLTALSGVPAYYWFKRKRNKSV
jgi:APA family basic amino acid/polyamine antiporter